MYRKLFSQSDFDSFCEAVAELIGARNVANNLKRILHYYQNDYTPGETADILGE